MDDTSTMGMHLFFMVILPRIGQQEKQLGLASFVGLVDVHK
jgi:hypothetical protein